MRTEEIKNENGEITNKFTYNDEGLFHGTQYFYKKGKIISKQNFENGEMLKAEVYSNEGNFLKSESYKNEERHGYQFYYYESGKMKEKSYYRNGELETTQIFYENGNLKLENNENGFKEYYESGNLKKIVEMKNGQLNGISATLRENNNVALIEEVNFFKNNELISMKKNINFDIHMEYDYLMKKNDVVIKLGQQKEIDIFEKGVLEQNIENLKKMEVIRVNKLKKELEKIQLERENHEKSFFIDRDNDGITDKEELEKYNTNAFSIDSDNDGRSDFQEIKDDYTRANDRLSKKIDFRHKKDERERDLDFELGR